MKIVFCLALALALTGPLFADTAEVADRYDLESVWKPGGRTFRPVDFPYSPRPGEYGGPDETAWGNEGYIFVNPKMAEFERVMPTPIPGEILPPPVTLDELLAQLRRQELAAEQMRLRIEELETEADAMREKAEDELIKRRKLEMEMAEMDRTAPPGGPGEGVVSAGAAPVSVETYMVGQDQSLWSIAGRPEVYGDPYRWLLLYHANRDQIFDPDLIYPGMVLLVPRQPEMPPPAATEAETAVEITLTEE